MVTSDVCCIASSNRLGTAKTSYAKMQPTPKFLVWYGPGRYPSGIAQARPMAELARAGLKGLDLAQAPKS
jgi:hypothetical protein